MAKEVIEELAGTVGKTYLDFERENA